MSNFKREHTKAARAFLDDIIEVYRKHNLSLSHEDCHGAFQIEPYDQLNIDWLCEAYEVEPVASTKPAAPMCIICGAHASLSGQNLCPAHDF